MPVAWKVWQLMVSGSPAARARRLIMSKTLLRCMDLEVMRRLRSMLRKSGLFLSRRMPAASRYSQRCDAQGPHAACRLSRAGETPSACPLAGSNPLKPQPVIPILAVVRFLDPEVQIPTASQLYSPLNQLCQLPPFCISIHRCNNHRPCWHLGCSGSDQLRLLGVKPPPAEDPSSETREQEMGVGPSDREGEATRIAVQEVARWYCYQGPGERMAPCAGSEVAFLSRRGSQF